MSHETKSIADRQDVLIRKMSDIEIRNIGQMWADIVLCQMKLKVLRISKMSLFAKCQTWKSDNIVLCHMKLKVVDISKMPFFLQNVRYQNQKCH